MTSTEMESKIRELEALRTQTRYWAWGTTAFVTLITIVSVGMLFSSVHNLFQPGPTRDEFTSTLTSDMKAQVLPQVQEIMSQTLTNSRPEVELAFTKLNTRVPELTSASLKQLDLLKTNIPERGTKALNTTYQAMLQKHGPKIRQMFPEATEENVGALVTGMTEEGQTQLVKANDTLFAKHLSAMNGIAADLDKIRSTEVVTPNQDQANWEMALDVVDMFHSDLQTMQSEGAQPQAAQKTGKETKK